MLIFFFFLIIVTTSGGGEIQNPSSPHKEDQAMPLID